MLRQVLTVLICLSAILAPRVCQADQFDLSGLPPPIVHRIGSDTSCAPEDGKVEASPTFLRRVDIDGDGLPDYIFDYSQFRCSKLGYGLCGTGGCSLVIFIATPPSATLALDDLLLDFKIYRYKGFAVVAAQGKYGFGFIKISTKPFVELKKLPPGGTRVVGN